MVELYRYILKKLFGARESNDDSFYKKNFNISAGF
jgi:hypothetical protein